MNTIEKLDRLLHIMKKICKRESMVDTWGDGYAIFNGISMETIKDEIIELNKEYQLVYNELKLTLKGE